VVHRVFFLKMVRGPKKVENHCFAETKAFVSNIIFGHQFFLFTFVLATQVCNKNLCFTHHGACYIKKHNNRKDEPTFIVCAVLLVGGKAVFFVFMLHCNKQKVKFSLFLTEESYSQVFKAFSAFCKGKHQARSKVRAEP